MTSQKDLPPKGTRPHVETIKELLAYDPDTGILTWKLRDRRYFQTNARWKSWNATYTGRQAGTIMGNGYLRIRIMDRTHGAHHLAFVIMTGAWPTQQVDHINHERDDNRWVNLREVTASENQQNASRHKGNTSGYPGVSIHKPSGLWQACIMWEGERLHFGYFKTREEADQKVSTALAALGFHPNHGIDLANGETPPRYTIIEVDEDIKAAA